MRDSELDRILSTAARRPIEVSPAVLERIARSLRTSIQPVRPLPPTWVLTARLLALNSLIAVAGAALSGFDAIGALNPKGRIALFVTLAILGYATGPESVSQFTPGSRHFVAPRVLATTIVRRNARDNCCGLRNPHELATSVNDRVVLSKSE
jgi:hypothetical protein